MVSILNYTIRPWVHKCSEQDSINRYKHCVNQQDEHCWPIAISWRNVICVAKPVKWKEWGMRVNTTPPKCLVYRKHNDVLKSVIKRKIMRKFVECIICFSQSSELWSSVTAFWVRFAKASAWWVISQTKFLRKMCMLFHSYLRCAHALGSHPDVSG